MDIRTEVSAPEGRLDSVSAVEVCPNAVLQHLIVRYLGMGLGPLSATVRTDPAFLSALSALTAWVSSGVGVPGATPSPRGGRPPFVSGLPGSAGHPFLAVNSFAGLSRDSRSVSVLALNLFWKLALAGKLSGDSSFSELSHRPSGAVTLTGPAQRLAGKGGLLSPGGAAAGCDVAGLGDAKGLSEAWAGKPRVVPAPSPTASVAGNIQAAENPLGGGPVPAREDARPKHNVHETQLSADKPAFARVQEIVIDGPVKSHLKFFGARKSRRSRRDRRERDKDRKRQRQHFPADQGESDEPESP